MDESNHPILEARHVQVERGESNEVAVLEVHHDQPGPLPKRLLNAIVEVHTKEQAEYVLKEIHNRV